MKIKSWLKYLAYSLITLALILLASYVCNQYRVTFKITFKPNLYLVSIYTLIYMMVGALLGLEHFIKELKKHGRWKINLPKLILSVIPSFYLAIFPLAFYSGIRFIIELFYPIFYLSSTVPGYGLSSQLFQVIFGYLFITSFNRQREDVYL